MYCKKCGKELNENSLFCSWCGTEMSEMNSEFVAKEESNSELNLKIESEEENTKNLKPLSKIIGKIKRLSIKKKLLSGLCIIVGLFIVFGVCFFSSSKNKLTGYNLAAYELISEVSYEFKNPSSVRVLSGCVWYDEDDKEYSGWFALSATNGWGARTTGYYFVGYLDGKIYALDLEEYGTSSSISYAKTRDQLDVDSINKALNEQWGMD